MRYLSKISTSPRFKLLVAHHKRASDPSRGEEGNPQPIRNGFECQTIVSQHGHAQLGRFLEKKIKLSIQINSLDFFNARIAQTPPFFDTDEILAYASRINVLDELPALKAGDDFGQDAGGGVGDIPTVASQLAKSLSEKNLGILATVDAVDNTLVNIKTESIDDDLVLKIVSYSYKLLNGLPPFIIKDSDGNVVYDPDTDDRGAKVIVKRNEDIAPISEI